MDGTAFGLRAGAEREDAAGRSGRRRAFETNLALNLADSLGMALHPAERARLVGLIGEAHEGVRHALDARASLGLAAKRIYTVLQFGARLRASAEDEEPTAGPLAARVMARLPAGALDGLTSRERAALAEAVELSEIRSMHPLDWRPRLRFGRFEVYVNLLAGRDRRRSDPAVTDDRRTPAAETAGLGALAVVAILVAGLGAWLVLSAALGVFDLLADPAGAALWKL